MESQKKNREWTEKSFKEVMAEKFPNLVKVITLHIQDSQ
jgi:hypothetical protein